MEGIEAAGDGVATGGGSTGVLATCEAVAGSITGDETEGSAGRGAGSCFGRATFTSGGVEGLPGRMMTGEAGAGAGVLDLEIVDADAFAVVLRSVAFLESVGAGAGVIVRDGRAPGFRIGLVGTAEIAGVLLRDTGITDGLFPHAAERGKAARVQLARHSLMKKSQRILTFRLI